MLSGGALRNRHSCFVRGMDLKAPWRWLRRSLRRWLYRRYLRSARWRETRLHAVRRAGFRCKRCGAGGRLDVHHLSYVRVGRERPDDLTVLCRECHRAEHAK